MEINITFYYTCYCLAFIASGRLFKYSAFASLKKVIRIITNRIVVKKCYFNNFEKVSVFVFFLIKFLYDYYFPVASVNSY